MPGTSPRSVHIDKLLTNMAIGYRPQGMIADMIMPIVPVMKQSDHYAVFSRADRLRIEDTNRAPGTYANRIKESVSSDTYYAENYALSYPVTIEQRANADPIFMTKILNGKTRFLLDKLYLDWENRVAGLVTNTSNVGSYAAVGSAWTDLTNSNPIADINAGIDNVQDSTGYRPNKLTFGEKAWRNFRRHDTVRNIIFGNNNGGGYASRQQVADLFEVDEVLVGGAYKNTANEAQSEVLTNVWGDHVLVSYTAPNPTMDDPSFAYSFRWQGNGLPAPLGVERHPYDSRAKSEEVEAGLYQDEKITGAEYGYLITNVTSST